MITDINEKQLKQLRTIVLVASLVGVGYTILNYVENRKLRKLQETLTKEQLKDKGINPEEVA